MNIKFPSDHSLLSNTVIGVNWKLFAAYRTFCVKASVFRVIGCSKRKCKLEIYSLHIRSRARGSVVVKALCYKLEGRGFDTR
jgi:hypothetical protein